MGSYSKAPDGGWGWVVAICCLVNHMCTVGILLSMSVLYVSWLDQFDGSKASTSWILSIGVAVTFGMCPLPANLATRFGFRAVGVIGALLMCTGLVISVFATSVTYLVVSLGFLTGLGACFCYLPGVAVVALYFDKRRPIAMGIATAGTGLGAFSIAPLVNYLDETYGWRGALLLLAGISLHMCVSAFLFRPLNIGEDDEDEKAPLREDLADEAATTTVHVQEIRHCDESTYCTTTTTTTTKNLNGKCEEHYENGGALLTENHNGVTPETFSKSISDDVDYAPSNSNGVNHAPFNRLIHPSVASLRQCPDGVVVGDSLDRLAIPKRLQTTASVPSRNGNSENMFISLNELSPKQTPSAHHRSLHSLSKHRIDRRYHDSLFKSLQNVDLNVVASIHGIHRILNESHLSADEMSSVQTLETKNIDCECEECVDIQENSKQASLMSRFLSSPTVRTNLEILHDKAFLMLCFSSFLTNLAFITPVVYMVDRAVNQGIDKYMGAVLISINGASNIFGRLIFGSIFYKRCSNRLLTYIVCNSACGVATMLSAMCGGQFFLHAIYATVFGCLIGMYSLLAPLVTVELMGVARLATSYSIALLFMGAATLIGPPLAGWLFDWTKSYVLSYVINGVFLLLSGVMLTPLLFVKKRNAHDEDMVTD